MTKEDKKFVFFVNDKRFDTEKQSLTGAQIKTIAEVDLASQLFLEEKGHDKPDRLIANDQAVDLGLPGVERFYTVAAATFGETR